MHARALWLDGDAGSAGFGSVVRGDRVVARRDGRDLWCQHLVCLGAFCEAVVEEFGRREEEEKGNGVGGSGARRSAGRKNVKVGEGMAERRMRFRRLACREEFELYWERWCQKKLGTTGLEEYSRMKGPYDM